MIIDRRRRVGAYQVSGGGSGEGRPLLMVRACWILRVCQEDEKAKASSLIANPDSGRGAPLLAMVLLSPGCTGVRYLAIVPSSV